MRLFLVLAAWACGAPQPTPVERLPDEPQRASGFADEDRYVPSYGKPDLQRALTVERQADTDADRKIAELERRDADPVTIAIARADRAVRQRFIVALETCEATGRLCPPQLDERAFDFALDGDRPPPLAATLRFDLASWRTIADELFGRACGCRTVTCIDGVMAAIGQLEVRPMPEVAADPQATLSITRARSCLYRLRGKRRVARTIE